MRTPQNAIIGVGPWAARELVNVITPYPDLSFSSAYSDSSIIRSSS
jgi:hypothetical protein